MRRRGAAAAAASSEAPPASAPVALPAPSPPHLLLLLLPLLAVRLCGALTSPITDCDETFNYWEPSHYLLYGAGLQTWEYSPVYGLRSYTYIAAHAAVAYVAAAVVENKVAVFFAVRAALGCAAALLEARFVQRVHAWANAEVGIYTWILLTTSAGMFHAAVAFLPSSFAMHCVLLAWTAWMDATMDQSAPCAPPTWRRSYAAAVFFVATGCIIGWPFLCIIAAPLAIDAISALGLVGFVKVALGAAVALVAPSAAFDSYLYGKPVLAWLNIMVYNRSAASGAG